MSALLIGVIAVTLLNLYAAVLIVLRARVYGVKLYRPMLLNIGLSFLPVLLAVVLGAGLLLLTPLIGRATEAIAGRARRRVGLPDRRDAAVARVLPELGVPDHRAQLQPSSRDHTGTLWYDIVQTLALTLSGIANAVLSLAVVQTMGLVLIDRPDGRIPAASWGFAATVILLGAIGVYLGALPAAQQLGHPASGINDPQVGRPPAPARKALEAFGFVSPTRCSSASSTCRCSHSAGPRSRRTL
jgi:hypothetical protein